MAKVMFFTRVCDSVHRWGACVPERGVSGGDVHGGERACLGGGGVHAWLGGGMHTGGACMAGGMCGRGVCVAGGRCA